MFQSTNQMFGSTMGKIQTSHPPGTKHLIRNQKKNISSMSESLVALIFKPASGCNMTTIGYGESLI